MNAARRKASALWGRHPAGTGLASSPWRSPRFYQEMRTTRYRQQPWHTRLLDGYRGGRLLEVGCGAGTDLAYLGRHFQHVVGVDLAETGARLACGAIDHWQVKGATLVADGEALPFADGEFDLVYSFGVLHHTDDPATALREFRRVLRPGGRVVVGVYHRWSLFAAHILVRYLLTARFRNESWDDFIARCEQGSVEEGIRPRLRLYSRRSARRLLGEFHEVRARTVHSAGFHAPSGGWLGRLIGAVWGWYVIAEGVR
jgi:SAM-dependent methyltransferase